MKHEWRKKEKEFYLPKNKPENIQIPEFKFFTIEGKGNPNSEKFSNYIEVLYSLSYAVKMSYKKGIEPTNYFHYTVYPLEGIWDISENAKQNFNGKIDKDELLFKLMIRQPDFVNEEFAMIILEETKKKKTNELLNNIKYEKINDDNSVQMMHLGSYDNEADSFKRMEDFAAANNLKRVSKVHREIYLTDPRKTLPEKLKTVLRFKVEKIIKT
ncbi:MAG: GyrI-like domain-containing protein [Ignavibacteriae bacterium]|nr:GyrI-like domain-containing protein [Ignavibacteriota bacterium]